MGEWFPMAAGFHGEWFPMGEWFHGRVAPHGRIDPSRSRPTRCFAMSGEDAAPDVDLHLWSRQLFSGTEALNNHGFGIKLAGYATELVDVTIDGTLPYVEGPTPWKMDLEWVNASGRWTGWLQELHDSAGRANHPDDHEEPPIGGEGGMVMSRMVWASRSVSGLAPISEWAAARSVVQSARGDHHQ